MTKTTAALKQKYQSPDRLLGAIERLGMDRALLAAPLGTDQSNDPEGNLRPENQSPSDVGKSATGETRIRDNPTGAENSTSYNVNYDEIAAVLDQYCGGKFGLNRDNAGLPFYGQTMDAYEESGQLDQTGTGVKPMMTPEKIAEMREKLRVLGMAPTDIEFIIQQCMLECANGLLAGDDETVPPLPGGGEPRPGGTMDPLNASREIVGDSVIHAANSVDHYNQRMAQVRDNAHHAMRIAIDQTLRKNPILWVDARNRKDVLTAVSIASAMVRRHGNLTMDTASVAPLALDQRMPGVRLPSIDGAGYAGPGSPSRERRVLTKAAIEGAPSFATRNPGAARVGFA